ncbi:hypothetical protein Esti_000738 [Eimeria stiedai]
MPRTQRLPSLWSCGHGRVLLWWLAIFTAIDLPRCSLSVRLWGNLGLPLSGIGAPEESRFSRGLPSTLANLGTRRLLDRLSNAQRSARCFTALGFQTLDLIKIFGRLADASAGNSALVSPYESAAAAAGEIIAAEENKKGAADGKAWSVRPWLELQQPSLLLRRPAGSRRRKRGEQQLQPWENLFVTKPTSSEEPPQAARMQQWRGLTVESFSQQIKELKFTWPTTINTGQAPLSLRSVPVANEVFVNTCRRMRENSSIRKKPNEGFKFSWGEVNDFVEKEKINSDALECVFRCFLVAAGSAAPLLCREDVLRCIWSWAPADGTVDWEQFLFFLDEFPSDNLQGAVD